MVEVLHNRNKRVDSGEPVVVIIRHHTQSPILTWKELKGPFSGGEGSHTPNSLSVSKEVDTSD